eukprot:Hpha_TRINITY_DN26838_c0_g1::TRINITY_DN26838_c0_g1_i1::g.17304::m.17304
MEWTAAAAAGESLRLTAEATKLHARAAGGEIPLTPFVRLSTAAAALFALRQLVGSCVASPRAAREDSRVSGVLDFVGPEAGRRGAVIVFALRRLLSGDARQHPPDGGGAAAEVLGRCRTELARLLFGAVPELLRASVVAEWGAAAEGADAQALPRATAQVRCLNEGLAVLVTAEPLFRVEAGASVRHAVGADALLANAAARRALAALRSTGASKLVEDGVAASDAALQSEEGAAEALCEAIASGLSGRPGTGGSAPLISVPVKRNSLSRSAAGVWLQGWNRAQLKAYYLSLYAAYLATPRLGAWEEGVSGE